MTQPQIRRTDENGSVFICNVWQHWNKAPKDGSWFYIIVLVQCRECQDGERFVIGYYDKESKQWLRSDGDLLEIEGWKIYRWMNIELFYHLGLSYNVDD